MDSRNACESFYKRQRFLPGALQLRTTSSQDSTKPISSDVVATFVDLTGHICKGGMYRNRAQNCPGHSEVVGGHPYLRNQHSMTLWRRQIEAFNK